MKNSRALFQEVVSRIKLAESPEEVQAIVYVLFEDVFGLYKTEVLLGKMVPYTQETAQRLEKAIKRINLHEPVQYVLGRESFHGRTFVVNPSVLIPRPETEELIRLVLLHNSTLASGGEENKSIRILDIGTGSGCIAITLFLELGDATVFATDVSSAALSVAAANADMLSAQITFLEHDILRETIPLQALDVIVSNPPYIAQAEKPAMQLAVTQFEPHLALFAPGDDVLLFYREIVRQARLVLRPGGLLAVEINEKYGQEIRELFVRGGFADVRVTQDISGKDRLVSGLSSAGLDAHLR